MVRPKHEAGDRVQLNVRLPEELLHSLTETAALQNVSRNELCCRLLAAGLLCGDSSGLKVQPIRHGILRDVDGSSVAT